MSTKSAVDVANLLNLVELINSSAKTIINEWAKAPNSGSSEVRSGLLDSRECYNAQRTILSAAGMLTEVVGEPNNRLLEVSSQYFESRALHIAAEHRIPDILAGHDEEGVAIGDIAAKIGIESLKLSRVLRCLCSIHLFKEVAPDVFANNSVTAKLVGNEPLRAYIMLFALDLYSASDYLPKALTDPVLGPSYAVEETAFQLAVGTKKPRWEWLEEKIPASQTHFERNGYPRNVKGVNGTHRVNEKTTNENCQNGNGTAEDSRNGTAAELGNVKPRPELEIFGLAMLGGGRVFGTAHIYDFPWASLGNGTVVDVGGGVGGFSLQLSKNYQNLKFVIQDREQAVKQGKHDVWPKENPQAIADGRVQFMPHDFFKTNPVKGADVYWLRYILHDWSDEYCVKILSSIRESMAPNSKILICDQVMNTTLGCPELPAAPSPLPSNYGYHTRYSHQRDLTMMAIINGIERTPDMFRDIAMRSGLVMNKIWECRSQVSLVELVRAD
ncbi:S-adenosyl-L-methionine-dependent methyltransferase [Pyronema omphalodes]|nr:S-adenosyl-L-methionine-dependent methyltransferase [Pyronema omphalodes]